MGAGDGDEGCFGEAFPGVEGCIEGEWQCFCAVGEGLGEGVGGGE